MLKYCTWLGYFLFILTKCECKYWQKRKKRDWLLSSSPPQLRRKIRPGSHPPSRQASRPSSPAEAGSSSPTSSLSPPSPSSPGVYNQNSQTNEEICPLCKEKGNKNLFKNLWSFAINLELVEDDNYLETMLSTPIVMNTCISRAIP